ncbi:hypothetical protein ACROHD_10685, partial [Nioella aestuarii]
RNTSSGLPSTERSKTSRPELAVPAGHGRLAPSPEDVAAMARPVLSHRMALSFAARAEGIELEAVIDTVTAQATRSEAAA